MKTYVLDDKWNDVVSGDMTIEEWLKQAKEGPEIDIDEDELDKMLDDE